MANISRICIVLAILLVIGAAVLRITFYPLVIADYPVKSSSIVILANTLLLIAILAKK